jgi:hypothetical protein
MNANQIHRVYLDGEFPKKDNRLALAALLAETIAVYYWSEAFAESRPMRICIIGQRGLAEYAAKATNAVLALIDKNALALQETEGFQFGSVVSLREALRLRREKEQRVPEYMDQCNVSTYRAKHSLGKYYKVGVKDVHAHFDVDGYHRGTKQVWTLKQFKTPIEVLNDYARARRHERVSGKSQGAVVQDRRDRDEGGRDQASAALREESPKEPPVGGSHDGDELR